MSCQLNIAPEVSKQWNTGWKAHTGFAIRNPLLCRRGDCDDAGVLFSAARIYSGVRGSVFNSYSSCNTSFTCLRHTCTPTSIFNASSEDTHGCFGSGRKTRFYCTGSVDSVDTQKAVEFVSASAFGLDCARADVLIVGAGIVGLSIAHRLLSTTDLSVALVDAAEPCAGATGAGQGYVWLGHRNPETVAWNLAKRSKYLWDKLALGLQASGLDPLKAFGFKKTGSLLFSSSLQDAVALEERADALHKGGVHVDFLNATSLKDVEPQLHLGSEGSAILTHDDCQIDAKLAVSYLLKEIKEHCSSGRFQQLFHEPAVSFLWDNQIRGIQTNRRKVYCKKLIVAAGGWSGQLMQNIFDRLSLSYVLPTKPRKVSIDAATLLSSLGLLFMSACNMLEMSIIYCKFLCPITLIGIQFLFSMVFGMMLAEINNFITQNLRPMFSSILCLFFLSSSGLTIGNSILSSRKKTESNE